MPFLNIFSNPVWRARGVFHVGPANAPTMYFYDGNGFASPSDGRQMGLEETRSVAEYNAGRALLNVMNRQVLDEAMGRLLPLSDGFYNPLDDFEASRFIKDISWLNDREPGDSFYNEWANFEVYDNGDDEGWMREARLSQLMEKANLGVDKNPLKRKVDSGISSPIVIDLDGDGIQTTSLRSSQAVFFDIDGDGHKDKTAWLSGTDAFLAVDKNGNGVIDGVNELFGGPGRGDGYAELAQYDGNGDGIINSDDAMYSELLLWQDSDANGLTGEGELKTAASAGLESIGVGYMSQDIYQHGNLLGEVSRAVYEGRNVEAIDVYFRFNHGSESNSTAVDASVAQLISAMATFSAPSGAGFESLPYEKMPISSLMVAPDMSRNHYE